MVFMFVFKHVTLLVIWKLQNVFSLFSICILINDLCNLGIEQGLNVRLNTSRLQVVMTGIPRWALFTSRIYLFSTVPATLSILRKLKYLAKYELRKQLAETLILSKLDYADLVFYPLPQFLLRRLQRVQFAAACFVVGHYVKNFRDVVKIGWLPINKGRDLNLLKSCFKALHNTKTWPDYLKIIKQECRK